MAFVSFGCLSVTHTLSLSLTHSLTHTHTLSLLLLHSRQFFDGSATSITGGRCCTVGALLRHSPASIELQLCSTLRTSTEQELQIGPMLATLAHSHGVARQAAPGVGVWYPCGSGEASPPYPQLHHYPQDVHVVYLVVYLRPMALSSQSHCPVWLGSGQAPKVRSTRRAAGAFGS